MRHTRRYSGFSLVEALAALAILIIVSALIIVAVYQFSRPVYQQEMDETAKEIYVAAQNHLTVAESLGTLSKKTPGTQDTVTEDGKKPGAGIYYFVIPQNATALTTSSSMLYTMLPPNSIDETVRTNGSYIIRYQYNGDTAKVMDVFYANPNGRYPYTLTSTDYATLFSDSVYTSTSDAGKEARANYEGAVIGYYGGEGASGSSESLATPVLEVYNAEILAARLTNPDAFTNCTFEFYAVGMKSGAISEPLIPTAGDAKTDSSGRQYYQAVFDSVTDYNSTKNEGLHFAELATSNGINFIPGENITIQVFALSKDATKVSKSAKRTTNSLFASLGTTDTSNIISAFTYTVSSVVTPATPPGVNAPQTAKITNIRHLENLSAAISGYSPNALGTDKPSSYEQTVDLSWSDFCKAVAGLSPSSADNAASKAVKVYALDGSSSAAHTFMPVDGTANTLTYNGNSRKISDVEVSNASDAGLFATLTGGSVSDLELVNFKVATTGGNAGTLAGTASGATLTNVFAHDTASSTSYGVTASGNAGGLVGSLTGGSVTGCAAAEYVSGSSGAAGGLVGTVSDSSITQSYSGGHTTNGAYSSSSFNVSAGGDAGGLVGMSSNTPITSCYSTCSASGNTAGGLVGSLTNGSSIVNCYATGLTSGNSHGALIGNLDRSGINRASNGYYPAYLQAVDPTVSAVGSDDRINDATVAESSTAAYEATVAGVPTTAAPYDSWLVSSMQSKYPYKTIKQLAGLGDSSLSGLSAHLTSHYGDWPVIERNVVNIR